MCGAFKRVCEPLLEEKSASTLGEALFIKTFAGTQITESVVRAGLERVLIVLRVALVQSS